MTDSGWARGVGPVLYSCTISGEPNDLFRCDRTRDRAVTTGPAILVLAALLLAAVLGGSAINPARAATPAQLKVVNYFPSRYAQGLFWNPWHPEVVDADFGVIADTLHANAVRIFVPTRQFGWPPPLSPTYTEEFAQLVSLAASHNLGVFVDLFNYWAPYLDVPHSEQWASDLLTPYAGDHRIVAVEVQPEIDPSNPAALAWARTMIPYVRRVDGGIPVTISVCGCDATSDLVFLHTALAGSQPDFYDFAYYPGSDADPSPAQAEATDEAQIQHVFAEAKAAVAPLPVLVGESGLSTYYPDTVNTATAASNPSFERVQANLYSKLEQAAKAEGLPPVAPWDYIDVAYGGGVTDVSQRFFGLFRTDGTPKPAVAVVAQAFSG
jgi:cellulase (glycosyl hydrolase family 5)